MHIELAPPVDQAPEGQLKDGSVIPLSAASNLSHHRADLGLGVDPAQRRWLGQLQEINQAFAKALAVARTTCGAFCPAGRLHRPAQRPDRRHHPATEKLNSLAGQVAASDEVRRQGAYRDPAALTVLADSRTKLADAIDALGKFSAVGTSTVSTRPRIPSSAICATSRRCSASLPTPGLRSPGTGLSSRRIRGEEHGCQLVPRRLRQHHPRHRPDPEPDRQQLVHGDEVGGDLTTLELQWGRTIGQMPSPYTAGNPLIAPYNWGAY